MKCYVWTYRPVGTEYVIFANSLKEAKKVLESLFDSSEVQTAFGNQEPEEKPIPKGFIFYSTPTWLR